MKLLQDMIDELDYLIDRAKYYQDTLKMPETLESLRITATKVEDEAQDMAQNEYDSGNEQGFEQGARVVKNDVENVMIEYNGETVEGLIAAIKAVL